MKEFKTKQQIESYLNSISEDYKCVVYNNDLDLACTALCDYIEAYKHLFSDEILFQLNEIRGFLSSQQSTIDSDDFDICDTFSVLVYEKKGVNNGR